MNTVACPCVLQTKRKKDPTLTAFNFSSVNTMQTGMCCYAHSAPYQSERIFFFHLSDLQGFFFCVCVGTQRQVSRSTTVSGQFFFFFLNQLLTLSLVPSSSSFSSFSPTKTNFSHLTPLVLALSCIHICHRMYLYICIFRCTDGLDSVSMLFHYIAYVFQR